MAATGDRRRAARPGEAGLTLLELLVAMTLLGMMFALATGGLRFGMAAWRASDETLSASEELQRVQSLLKRHLSEMLPVRRTGDRRGTLAFAGYPDRIDYQGPALAGALADGIYDTTIRVEGGRRLALSWRRFDYDAEAGGAPSRPRRDDSDKESVLLDHLADGSFAYYGTIEGETAPAWHASWVDQRHLPELVRIELRWPAEDRRRWPVLLIAPRLGGA